MIGPEARRLEGLVIFSVYIGPGGAEPAERMLVDRSLEGTDGDGDGDLEGPWILPIPLEVPIMLLYGES